MKNKILNFSKGFTVLESIVAIGILSLSISGAFSSVVQSLAQASITKDEVTAYYLAQEAIEIVRNQRDHNQLSIINGALGVTWLDGITSACPFSTDIVKNTCTVDATNLQISNCHGSWDSCTQNLKQDPNTYLYGYTSGNATNFKREIQIERVQNDTFGNPIEISVTVRIVWTRGSLITKEFKIKEHLFNWL